MQVGAFGFPEQQRSKIEKIIKMSRNHQYQLVTFDGVRWPELILVFGEQALSQSPLDQLPDHLHARVVIVSRNRPELAQYQHLGYPLISSRVVRVLDQLADQAASEAPHIVSESATDLTESELSERENKVSDAVDTQTDTQTAPVITMASPAPIEHEVLTTSEVQPKETSQVVPEASLAASDPDLSAVPEPMVDVVEARQEESISSDLSSAVSETLETESERVELHVSPQSSAVSADVTPSASDEVSSGNELTVLVVDDSAPMRKALANELEGLPIDMSIEFAENGELALEMAKDGNFDLIFLDIMMPGIDGFETCTELRKMAHIKKTPIIMLSSKTSPLDEVKGIMAGCSTYLTKPIVPEEFKKVMLRVTKWITEYRPERMAAMAKLRTSVSG